MAGAGYGISDGAGGFVTKLEGDGDAKIGNSAEDVIQITGSLKVAGGAVFNEGSIAADFRVEGNNSDHMFFIDGTSDRIGIDTDSPEALLHISSSATGVLFRIDHPDAGIDNPIFFVTGSSGNSRVGIGTETPDATFAISDNGKVLEVGSADEGSWLEVNNGTVYLNLGGGKTIAGGDDLGQRFNISPINATAGALGIGKYPGATVNIVEVNSENSDQGGDFFVINSSGKVGIGKTSPTHALHVANGGPSSLYLEADTDNVDEDDTSYIKFTQDGGNTGTVLGLCPNSASKDPEGTAYTGALGSSFLVGTTTSTAIQFGTNDNVRMTIKQAGNVGIGTTNPSVSLDVDGSVHCQGQFARGTATKDLGSGTTSTITPSSLGAGTVLITATSATTPTSGATEMMHVCTIADGTTAGELLTLVLVTTALDGSTGADRMGVILFTPTNPLNPSEITTVVGEASAGTSPIGTTVQYIWTGSKWARLSVNGNAT